MLEISKIFKLFKVLVAFCAASMFYFPFEFTFLPGRNVKMLMAALGVVIIGISLARRQKLEVPKNLVPLFIMACIVSLIGLFSMVFNGTIDDAYAGYIASMAVWLSAAFVACSAIKWAHGRISLELVGNYLIILCVAQCIEAIMIDNIPAFQKFVDAYINVDQRTLHEIHRLYGIGANLDVAGARFSAVLVVLTHLAYNLDIETHKAKFWMYMISYAIILVLGSMIARTTYVGVVLSFGYIAFNPDTWTSDISQNALRKIFPIIGAITISVILCIYLYNTNPRFK